MHYSRVLQILAGRRKTGRNSQVRFREYQGKVRLLWTLILLPDGLHSNFRLAVSGLETGVENLFSGHAAHQTPGCQARHTGMSEATRVMATEMISSCAFVNAR